MVRATHYGIVHTGIIGWTNVKIIIGRTRQSQNLDRFPNPNFNSRSKEGKEQSAKTLSLEDLLVKTQKYKKYRAWKISAVVRMN